MAKSQPSDIEKLWRLLEETTPEPALLVPGYIEDEDGTLYVWNGLQYVLAPEATHPESR